jgi:hypothetical protein
MLQRVFPIFISLAFLAAQAQADNTIKNNANKEWKVSYEPGEQWAFAGFKNRELHGIRLQIKENGGAYTATIRLFKYDEHGAWGFVGRKKDFPLATQVAGSSNRKRVGFQSGAIQTEGGTTTDGSANPIIRVNGIWQKGRGNSDSHAMQIKVHNFSSIAKVAVPGCGYGDCEDDPDTDVLEEGTDQGDTDNPPTDP